MSGIKKYDIDGVADNLQLGKNGPRIVADTNGVHIANKDGSLITLQAAPGDSVDDVATVGQLSSAAESAERATTTLAATLTASITTLQSQLASAQATAASDLASQINNLQTQIVTLQTIIKSLTPEAPTVYVVKAGTTGSVELGSVNEGLRVTSIEIDVTTAFDGGSSIEIGNDSTADFYMGSDLSDLDNVGTYGATPPATPDDRTIKLTLTGTSTVGEATVRLRYA